MQEYDRTRQHNHRLESERLQEVYSSLPEIRDIDQAIASDSLQAARRMLYDPSSDCRAELHTRVEQLIRRKRELLIRNHFPADYLEPVYSCTYCKDTGYVDNRKCFCFEQKILNLLYEQSNLTSAIREQNFDSFRLDYYSTQVPANMQLSPRENMQQVLDISYDYIRHFKEKPGQNLLIHGHPGVGKTFLTTCIAAELIKAGHSVIYLTAYELFEQLADYTFRREEENEHTLPLIRSADLLIIDDLGTELNNAFINSQLFLCINDRILKKRSTIINTNLPLREISQIYTERISSRLIQYYTILHIYGDDIRIKKAFSAID